MSDWYKKQQSADGMMTNDLYRLDIKLLHNSTDITEWVIDFKQAAYGE